MLKDIALTLENVVMSRKRFWSLVWGQTCKTIRRWVFTELWIQCAMLVSKINMKFHCQIMRKWITLNSSIFLNHQLKALVFQMNSVTANRLLPTTILQGKKVFCKLRRKIDWLNLRSTTVSILVCHRTTSLLFIFLILH